MAQDRLGEGFSQLPDIPRCGEDIDVGQADLQFGKGGFERPARKLERVLLAIEPFLLQDKSRNAVFQQGETTVVSFGDEAQDSQGNSFSSLTTEIGRGSPGSSVGLTHVSVRRDADASGRARPSRLLFQ